MRLGRISLKKEKECGKKVRRSNSGKIQANGQDWFMVIEQDYLSLRPNTCEI
jgi:hypothetical protein